jgi:hypothetical protein
VDSQDRSPEAISRAAISLVAISLVATRSRNLAASPDKSREEDLPAKGGSAETTVV